MSKRAPRKKAEPEAPAASSRLDLPYRNLVLTGFVGVGKTAIGRYIAQTANAEFLDIDDEIERREVMSIPAIRELYGESRLRALEHEWCRHAALMRRSVVIVPGSALLEVRNTALLSDSGLIVVLSCELGEALRRLHMASDQHYRDKTLRHRMLARLRREYAVVNDSRFLQIDTTHLPVEQAGDLLMKVWQGEEPPEDVFRYGPPPRITPPEKPTVGLSTHWREVKRKRRG